MKLTAHLTIEVDGPATRALAKHLLQKVRDLRDEDLADWALELVNNAIEEILISQAKT